MTDGFRSDPAEPLRHSSPAPPGQARTLRPSVDAANGVLVTGTPRSGTTWVGRMLALASRYFYVHEPFNNRNRRRLPHLLGRPVKPYYRYIPVGDDFPTISRFLDYVLGRADELVSTDRSSWSAEEQALFDEMGRQRASGAVPVVKDPISVLSMEWIGHRYGIPVIAMVRHPAEFVRSMIRLGWVTGARKFLVQPEFASTLSESVVEEIVAMPTDTPSPRKAALLWKVINAHIHSVARRNPQSVCVVRHEDLAGDPLAGFVRITRWLGIHDDRLIRQIMTYSDARNPAEPEHHWDVRRSSQAIRHRWRQFFDDQDKRDIQAIVEPVSELFDYSF